jgi:3-oxoadipate CoA-transferase alpha subunit
MINKISASIEEALAPIRDGATVMIGGFGGAGQPAELIDGLIAHGAKDLVIVNNNAGNGDTGLAALLKTGNVRKIICSFPRQADSHVFDALYRAGKLELELVPQGNLAERALRRPAPARCWPKARRRARSTAAPTCSNIPSTPMSR